MFHRTQIMFQLHRNGKFLESFSSKNLEKIYGGLIRVGKMRHSPDTKQYWTSLPEDPAVSPGSGTILALRV